jgi:type III secretory pathway component EscV
MVVASLLVPLPPLVLDMLLVINFMIAIGLVIVTLQLTDSLQLSSLPTILLLSTLFRLCLNVTSTRMILTYGSAGTVIESFGSFVLGGSVGVGVIIFIMLTLIQFIVVAKGSERVAEVAARFTLDALPGKQMAIDADVRAGLYDMQTARQKRQDLQVESRFYGALDGAMKFVKGDAIAAMCIVVINGIGGVVTGLVSGMSFAETLHHYSVLTVGDGIASQIPSLLNSLAAGLVVTRVAGGKNASLSVEVLEQLLRSKMMLRIGGLLLLVMACLPGMPTIALVLTAMMLFGVQFLRPADVLVKEPDIVMQPFQPHVIPLLLVRIPQSFVAFEARQALEHARRAVFERTGLLLGVIPVEVHESNECRIELRGVSVQRLCGDAVSPQRLTELVTDFCLSSRAELIDDTLVRRLLDWHEPHMSDLATTIVPHVISLTHLTELLRSLALEDLSVRPFDVILQGIAELHAKVSAERPLSEELRSYMKRYLCAGILMRRTDPALDDATLRVALFDESYESLPWSDAVISADDMQHIRDTLQSLQSKIDCLLVAKHIRRAVSEWLKAYGCLVPVMTHTEVMGNLQLEVITTLSRQDIVGGMQHEIRLAA